MATLIRNDLQVKACDEINAMLSEIQMLNNAIVSGSETFRVCFGRAGKGKAENGKKVAIDPVYDDKIIGILTMQRVKRIKTIKAKAAKFQIGLDESDLRIISDDAIKATAAKENSPVSEEAGQAPLAVDYGE